MVAIFFALRSMSGAAMLAAVLIGSVFAFGVIFAFAPVEHENNPLDEGKRVAERKKARIILCCEIIIAFLLIYAFKFDIAVLLGLGLVAAFVSASMSLIAAKITQRKG